MIFSGSSKVRDNLVRLPKQVVQLLACLRAPIHDTRTRRRIGKLVELAEVRPLTICNPLGIRFPALVVHTGIVVAAGTTDMQITSAARTLRVTRNGSQGTVG